MNKFLILSAALAVSASAMGQAPLKLAGNVATRQATGIKAEVSRTDGGNVLVYTQKDGKQIKKLVNRNLNKTVRPQTARAIAREDGMESANVLFESFEGWDGTTETWVPDGWTVESYGDPTHEYIHKWFPTGQTTMGPAPVDGKYMYGVIFSATDQDEWLISPEINVGEYMNLYYNMNLQPLWFYDVYSDTAFDWNTVSFIGEPQIIFDIKVNVREAGGQWVTVKDYAEEFKSMTATEMMNYNAEGALIPLSVDLSAYQGKKIQIAFQYVGKNGQSYFIDNIRVGLPDLDAPVYMMPMNTQYWGFNRQLEGTQFTSAILPVFEDLTFSSYDYVEGGNYTWSYNDPANADNWLTQEGDMLTVSYGTDYTNDFTTRDNLYYLPTLNVSATGGAPADYKNPADYMQIGGKPNFTFNDGKSIEMGMIPFQLHNDGLGTYTYSPDFGKVIPIYGYDSQVDAFWTDYTLNGDTEEGLSVKMTKIVNFIYPSATSATVVTGVHLPAGVHNIGENVEFTAGIYPCLINDEGYAPDFNNPVAKATILGKDVKILEPGDQKPDIAMLGFTFDQPAVLQSSEEVAAYVVAVEGFNNPEVGYFIPFQQLYPADVPMALGWIYKEITRQGETNWSISNLIDFDIDEPMFCAFAIGLEGYLPWLHCDTETLEISNNGTVIGLDSYYAAEDLTVTAPEWAHVTLTGRYGETILTVTAEFTETAREGEITITAPGVSKTFKLTQAAGTGSGIADVIVSGDDTVTAVFNLAGQQVSEKNLPAGIYLVKYASGEVKKVAVK